jgi:DNA-binding response OmpR family regulator
LLTAHGGEMQKDKKELECLGVCFDPNTYIVRVIGREIRVLTATECRLLGRLMRNPGRILDRRQLVTELPEGERFERSVDTHVKRLRAKLFNNKEAGLLFIEVIRGSGYRVPTKEQLESRLQDREATKQKRRRP